MKAIPENFHDLLDNEKRSFSFLGTIMKNGSPQVTPIWFNVQGEYLLINSAKGRIKDKNMRRNPLVALCIQDPNNPYRYLQIQGRIIEISENGADEHIDALAKKYTGVDKYPYRQPGEVRVRYTIQINKVDAHG